MEATHLYFFLVSLIGKKLRAELLVDQYFGCQKSLNLIPMDFGTLGM
jgi:hypothetical protein